jgi:hypothetical protein
MVVQFNGATSPPSYTFSQWVEEDSGIPRVMGDATLLPNGDIVLLNGGQVCISACVRLDALRGGPSFWPVLFHLAHPVHVIGSLALQRGLAGDAATGGGARSTWPNFWAQLYQPDAPVNSRYTTLAASTIARLYHSTAALTTNGTILVTGCDRCAVVPTDRPWYNPPPVKVRACVTTPGNRGACA